VFTDGRLVIICLYYQVRFSRPVGPWRLVVGAGEGEEGVGAVRAVVVAGTVIPDAVVVVPFLAVVPQPLQAEIAGCLVELAGREDGARLGDGLALHSWALHAERTEAEALHHSQSRSRAHSRSQEM
jgi:hypothetical protein